MKISYCILSVLLMTALIHTQASAQNSSRDMEQYSRQHIAFTDGKLLGINKKEYAECVRSVNFKDPSLTHKYVVLNGTRFSDDGKNNDLVAGDGILTSEKSLPYQTYDIPLEPGTYKPSSTNLWVADKQFSHAVPQSIASEWISLECKFVWKKCSAWPANLVSLCEKFSWPFTGGFEVVECKIGLSH